ncbi:M28 family peptidase [candidate division KSB1 bacterium]
MKINARQLAATCFILILVLAVKGLRAQESPFLTENLATYLNNELSGDRGFEYIRWMSHYHRPSGSIGYDAVAKLIHDWSLEFEFDNVQTVKQDYEGGTNWDAISGELWLVEPQEIKLGSYAEIAVSVPNNCPSAHETVELVYVGSGLSDRDFADKNVRGKAVLTSSSPGALMETAVWQRGAAGVISFYNSRPNALHDLPDQVAYSRISVASADGRPSRWAFMISPRKGTMIQSILEDAEADNRPVRIKVDIDTEFNEPVTQSYVWAEIPGSEVHNQDIVLTSHIQEEKSSSNDDASGCASMLEIGRTINRLIDEGRIPRPRRDIILWWANEISSEYQYFRDHPQERNNMLININQDMVGAKQSMGSRVQHIIRTPYSIPSYLNDVIESITEYVVLTNTAFLSAGQAGTPQPFSKPILSHLGTRERYNAMMVPYFDSSDHMVFCEGIVGVPGVGLINWPDFYIHSTADDLDNIDQTQLKRNAFIVAATSLFIANAGDDDVPMIASEVFSRGLMRIAKDAGVAFYHVKDNKSGSSVQSYKEARNLIQQAVLRESKAVESVLVFADRGGKNEEYVRKQIEKIHDKENEFVGDLDELYQVVYGERAPRIELTAEERTMASKVPANIESVDEYFEKRGRVRSGGTLHGLMAWECYNFVNGRNSYLDIFNAVHAEAMSAGAFYYGTVSTQGVNELLDSAVEAGILTLK